MGDEASPQSSHLTDTHEHFSSATGVHSLALDASVTPHTYISPDDFYQALLAMIVILGVGVFSHPVKGNRKTLELSS